MCGEEISDPGWHVARAKMLEGGPRLSEGTFRDGVGPFGALEGPITSAREFRALEGTGTRLLEISPRYRARMTTTDLGAALRTRRLGAGLSPRALATRAGVPQPNIAAYESGRRIPSPGTLERLDGVLLTPTLPRLRGLRQPIIEAARSRRLSEIGVFGSVARGTAGARSDVALLVHPAPDASLFDLAGFMSEVEELVGASVNVVSDGGRGATMERILAEAVAL